MVPFVACGLGIVVQKHAFIRVGFCARFGGCTGKVDVVVVRAWML